MKLLNQLVPHTTFGKFMLVMKLYLFWNFFKRVKRDIVELVDRCTATVLFLLRRELDEIRNKVYKEKID